MKLVFEPKGKFDRKYRLSLRKFLSPNVEGAPDADVTFAPDGGRALVVAGKIVQEWQEVAMPGFAVALHDPLLTRTLAVWSNRNLIVGNRRARAGRRKGQKVDRILRELARTASKWSDAERVKAVVDRVGCTATYVRNRMKEHDGK